MRWRLAILAAASAELAKEKRLAALEELQKERWAWLEEIKPSTRSWPKMRRQSVTRWRATGGNLTVPRSGPLSKLFLPFGDVYVRRDAFYTDSWGSNLDVEALREMQMIGTKYMQFMGSMLSRLGEEIGKASAGIINARSWVMIKDALMRSFETTPLAIDDEYEDPFTFGDEDREAARLSFLTGRVTSDIRRLAHLAASASDAIDTIYLLELGCMGSGQREPYPGFLEFVDLESRLVSLSLLSAFAGSALSWQMTFQVTSAFQSAMRRLKLKVETAEKSYLALLKKFGNRYVDVSGSYYRSTERGRELPSAEEKAEAKKYLAQLRALPKKIAQGGGARPDDLPASLQIPFSVMPRMTIHIRMDNDEIPIFELGPIEGHVSERVGDKTGAKFEAYKELITSVWKAELGFNLYREATQNVKMLLNRPGGVMLTAHLRTELQCIYQRDTHSTRMMELLYIHIPNLTGSIPAHSQYQTGLVEPKADSKRWLLVGFVYDSKLDTEKSANGRAPSKKALTLLKSYLRDEAETRGVMVDYPGQFVDMSGKGTCTANPLFNVVSQHISSRGKNNRRAMASFCPLYPEWFKRDTLAYKAFPMCLNLYPVGTQFLIKGETAPLPPMEKHPIDAAIEVVGLKELAGGKGRPRGARRGFGGFGGFGGFFLQQNFQARPQQVSPLSFASILHSQSQPAIRPHHQIAVEAVEPPLAKFDWADALAVKPTTPPPETTTTTERVWTLPPVSPDDEELPQVPTTTAAPTSSASSTPLPAIAERKTIHPQVSLVTFCTPDLMLDAEMQIATFSEVLEIPPAQFEACLRGDHLLGEKSMHPPKDLQSIESRPPDSTTWLGDLTASRVPLRGAPV